MKSIPIKLPNLKASTRALVDDEDYEELIKYRWYLTLGKYAVRAERRKDENGKIILTKSGNRKMHIVYMHRMILGAKLGELVDHKNRNELDNRKENLRFCNASQNAQNADRRKANEFIGVTPNGKKFKANIKVNKKLKHLGTFNTQEEAAESRDAYIKQMRDEFSILNF